MSFHTAKAALWESNASGDLHVAHDHASGFGKLQKPGDKVPFWELQEPNTSRDSCQDRVLPPPRASSFLWDSNRDPAQGRKSVARHPLDGGDELVIALQSGRLHRRIPHGRHQPTQRPGRRPAERWVTDKLPKRHAVEAAAKVVEELVVRVAPTLAFLVYGRVIGTTAEHPFYLLGQGWRCAKELQTGDWLISHERVPVRLEEVRETAEVATVYNLRVADYHTYFVGSREWGFSVWAHNANYVFEASTGRLFQVEGNGTRTLVRDLAGNPRVFANAQEAAAAIRSGAGRPYVNVNPRATAQEAALGELLDREAAAGNLSGIRSVEGAAELPDVRSGDYRITLNNDTVVAADAYHPASSRIANIADNAILKSGQAEAVVIEFGAGGTAGFGQTEAEAIASHILTTPDHSIRRVIVVKDGRILLNPT